MCTGFAQLYVVYSFMQAVHGIQASWTQNAGWMKIQPCKNHYSDQLGNVDSFGLNVSCKEKWETWQQNENANCRVGMQIWFYHLFRLTMGINLSIWTVVHPPLAARRDKTNPTIKTYSSKQKLKSRNGQKQHDSPIHGQTKGGLEPASSTLAHWTTVQLCHRRISVNTLHEGCCYSHLEELQAGRGYVLRGRLWSWTKSAARPIDLYLPLLSWIFEQSK